MSKLHLIMPMGGAGSRFFKDGFVQPKPLIKIHDKPFFYWATKSITDHIHPASLTFVVLQEHVYEFDIQTKITNYFPDAKFVILPKMLNGALLTSLEGIRDISEDAPILFNDCDHMFCCSEFNAFIEQSDLSSIDAALLTFNSNKDKFSYVKLNEQGYIEKTVEKQVISNDAICGAYYFKNKEILKKSASIYLKNCNYSEFFMSGIYNVLAETGYKMKKFSVDFHLSFGTPEEYYDAEKSDKFKD
ncbi:sugar phosphate nucleotidyltransferase [Sedimentibacter sp.]|uniref:sugar phosphate nucleotidyltransferase n=1 Tax=Sedimentibacter sp. TaxID=1960295 RepID=UPI00289AD4BE|nr:sugar phosphate nucleotidyltransferase [Sedimentibacter sp.]